MSRQASHSLAPESSQTPVEYSYTNQHGIDQGSSSSRPNGNYFRAPKPEVEINPGKPRSNSIHSQSHSVITLVDSISDYRGYTPTQSSTPVQGYKKNRHPDDDIKAGYNFGLASNTRQGQVAEIYDMLEQGVQVDKNMIARARMIFCQFSMSMLQDIQNAEKTLESYTAGQFDQRQWSQKGDILGREEIARGVQKLLEFVFRKEQDLSSYEENLRKREEILDSKEADAFDNTILQQNIDKKAHAEKKQQQLQKDLDKKRETIQMRQQAEQLAQIERKKVEDDRKREAEARLQGGRKREEAQRREAVSKSQVRMSANTDHSQAAPKDGAYYLSRNIRELQANAPPSNSAVTNARNNGNTGEQFAISQKPSQKEGLLYKRWFPPGYVAKEQPQVKRPLQLE